MKKKKTLLLLGFFSLFCMMTLFAEDNPTKLSSQIKVTPELQKKFSMKEHHAKLSLQCTDCHEGQGNDPEKFTMIGDEGCLSCHKSKQYLADRLKFMDVTHTNPHNSIHDGPRLYCDECHNEHRESTNMCLECHSNDVKNWMRATP